LVLVTLPGKVIGIVAGHVLSDVESVTAVIAPAVKSVVQVRLGEQPSRVIRFLKVVANYGESVQLFAGEKLIMTHVVVF